MILSLYLYFKIEIYLFFLIISILVLYLFNKLFKLQFNILIYILIINLFIIVVYLLKLLLNSEFNQALLLLNNYFIFSNYYNFIKVIVILFTILYLLYLFNYNCIINISYIYEYLIIIFTAILSFILIIISNNIFVMFLFLELINLCLYCLIGLNKFSNKGIESAFKYFIQSSFATIIGFFGLSLIYITTGTLFLNELSILVNYDTNFNLVFNIGLYCIITSIFFKLGLFPFHTWIADIYQGATLNTLVFFATIPKISYIILFLKLFSEFNSIIDNYCFLIALISIFYGAIIALYQINFRRLLAYGSMSHVGLIILSVILNTPDSLTSGIFYLIFYIVLIFSVIFFILFFFKKDSINNNIIEVINITQFYLFLNKNRLYFYYLAIIILSLAGLPFFIGFISKWYILLGILFKNKIFEVLLLLCIGIISTVYYIRVLRFIFFSNIKDNKIYFYTTLKYTNKYFDFIYFLVIINFLLIFFHSYIYISILYFILTNL